MACDVVLLKVLLLTLVVVVLEIDCVVVEALQLPLDSAHDHDTNHDTTQHAAAEHF